MHFGLASYGLALLAGLLSTLSPCVLPIVPILIGSALNAHRREPLALAAGLALSYAVLGTALAWAGGALSFDSEWVRRFGAGLLGLFGLVLLSGSLQQRFAVATSGIGDAGNRLLSRLHLDGLSGQFVVGTVLGVIWSPCVGPTLGSAIVLASQGQNLGRAAVLMGIFGVGAALPILVLAYLSRSAMMSVRGKMMQAGKMGKVSLGLAMLLIAVATLTGTDRPVEAWVVSHSPAWVTNITTRF
jgi:cytochrome c-type biogenesis protein